MGVATGVVALPAIVASAPAATSSMNSLNLFLARNPAYMEVAIDVANLGLTPSSAIGASYFMWDNRGRIIHDD